MVLAIGIECGQACGVPTIQESARRWRGFVCPDCRFVFRIPRDHDGQGVVCPSCRRLLKLPGDGDVIPPLLAASQPPGNDVADGAQPMPTDDGARVRRSRRRRRHREESEDWESAENRDEKPEEARSGLLMLAGGMTFLVAIMLAVFFATRTNRADDTTVGLELPQIQSVGDAAASQPADAPRPPGRTLSQFVTEARAVATEFLNAATVDQLLAVVADPEVVESKIREAHPDGMVEARGLADYSQFAQIESTDEYVIVHVHTADHLLHRMAFHESPDGLKVDWESWVGWSDVPMRDFIAERPAGRHAFRVELGAVEYYNFDFADDRKWQSFRLRSPDGEHSLFGYAERSTAAHTKVREALDAEIKQLIVEVEFPEGGSSMAPQALITDVISRNWIHPDRIAAP